MATETVEELMTPDEVAKVLKVKTATVYQMKKRGILKAADIGIASVRFRRQDVEALIQGRANTLAATLK